jgi:predicted transposase/invertase (TIGR01784 family)
MDGAIQKAEEKMAYVCNDKEALRAYHMREMAMSDWTSARNDAIEEGMEMGIERGIERGIEMTARNLKALGISAVQIAQATGLTENEIAAL